MEVTAYKTPGTCANVDRGQAAWANPDNAKTSNDAYASSEMGKSGQSNWLRVTNFDFTTTDIPAGATIDGFDVKIERKASPGNAIFDLGLYLRKTAGQQGSNKASAVKWGTSDAEITYNWTSGQFGTLIDSDIQDSGFGADLAVENYPDGISTAYVDVISIRVYYTIPPPNTGATLPSLGSTEDRDGKVAWTDPTNIQAEAGYTYSGILASTYSDWLRASDFGFTIPSTATIDGIKVEIYRAGSYTNKLKDSSLRLVDASGTNVGDDKASASYWLTAPTTVAYGSDGDTWGASPTPAMVNDSDFGIRLSAANVDTENRVALVYWVKITVYYTEAGGATLEISLSDTLAISDSISKTVELNKSESVSISDSIAKTIGLVKADTVTIADAIAKLISLGKSELVTITDTFTKAMSYALSLADNVGITDSISKAISLVKADAMAITDSMTSVLGTFHSIILSDLVTIIDSLEGILRTKVYLKQAVAQMEIKGMDIAKMSIKGLDIAQMEIKGMDVARISRKGIDMARMGIKRMNIDKTPLYRWITRRWTA